MPNRIEPDRIPFDPGPITGKGDPALAALIREMRVDLDMTSLATDVKPAVDGYELGTDDQPWERVNARNAYLRGTTTMSASYQAMMQGTILDFATNTTLIVLPIYTNGASPFDNWHPASPWFRDGAFWLTIGSPKKMHCRMGGIDRIIAVFDTATSTYAGTSLLERGQVDGTPTDYAVQFSKNQFPDDWDKLGLDIRGTSTFSTVNVTGAVSGISLPDLDDVGALAYSAGRYLRADGDSYEEAQIDAGDIATGQLAHERGGLEADVSGYSGFIRIDAGVTSNVGETGSGSVVRASSPTIVTPTIASFVNAGHNHQDAAGGGQLDHGLALTGLGDDDHTQYLLVSGSRAMTGDLDMGGNTVINAQLSTDSDFLKVLFGAGDDASIYYDGSNLILDSQEVGSGDFVFMNGDVGVGTSSPGAKLDVNGDLKIDGNWLLQSETEGGTDRLTVKSVGANSAAELFLHPTGSATSSRLTIVDDPNTTNYEGIAIQATSTENTIDSIENGTGTAQPLVLKMDGTDAITIQQGGDIVLTNGNVGVGLGNDATATPQELLHVGDGANPGVLPVTRLLVSRDSANVCLAVRYDFTGAGDGGEVAVWAGADSTWVGSTTGVKIEFGASNGVHIRIDTGGRVTILTGPLDLNAKDIVDVGSVGIGTSSPNMELDCRGGLGLPTTEKTENYTAASSDHTILCDTDTIGGFTVTLPAAADVPGLELVVKKIDAGSNTCTVDGSGAETIDGATQVALSSQYEFVGMQSDGTEWWITRFG